ncbi:G-type lectin S-receptor-like serine/threonine-protein kinase LECRK4 [Lycium barbarum]|uniref:G-type lectin S-receptor-like serine/threonine-protein kinase LECRK4 n=1 Tax=Lycium barbarum TaxID=112863 RepID=UPI00293E4744|nr:G-type lectin S-receptor-like serine/threonine-protein kinase LECRK4 [Lycium barbarum]
MAALLWSLLLSAFHAVALAQQRHFNITLDSSLTPTANTSWFSPTRTLPLGFMNKPMAMLLESPSSAGGKEICVINPSQAIASASMLDTGNFVIYNSDHNVIWQSFDNPTNTLLPGQHLSAGQELFSSASKADDSFRTFRLKMQNDGNLVQYPVHTPDDVSYAYFATETNTAGNNVTLNLNDDAHLYWFNSTISLINLTNKGYLRERTIIYVTKIDVDDDQIKCACLPGFDFVMQGKWSSGCERNFTAETCRLKENTSKYYVMRTVDNTKWEDISCDVLVTTTKEDCEQACLQDCNCGAALFKATECRKQMLPLRYGRRDMSNANQALVKVGINVVAKKGLPNQNEETNNNNNIPIITKGKKLRIDFVIASITLAVFALLVLGISGFLIHRNHWTYRKIQESRSVQLCENVAPRAFSYAELEQANQWFQRRIKKRSIWNGI